VSFNGKTNEGINHYLTLNSANNFNIPLRDIKDRNGKGEIKIVDIEILDKNGNKIYTVRTGEKVIIKVYFENNGSSFFKKCKLSIAISNQEKNFILLSTELLANNYFEIHNEGNIQFIIPKLPLTKSNYDFEIYLESESEVQDWVKNAIVLSVEDGVYYEGGVNYPRGWEGKTVLFDYTYTIQNS
jgi:lipopolysaccharide transport system ATP-binding protein